MAFYIYTSLPLLSKKRRQRIVLAGLSAKKLFQSICSRRGTVFYRVMPKKIVLLICRWKEKNRHSSGFSSVWEIFIIRPQVFLSSFFSSQRFSPLTLHSAADSQLCFFSRTGFFLALHTLCFIVFWKSSFVVRCSTAAYFSSFFLGSGLSSVTGHTTFHIHIGPTINKQYHNLYFVYQSQRRFQILQSHHTSNKLKKS